MNQWAFRTGSFTTKVFELEGREICTLNESQAGNAVMLTQFPHMFNFIEEIKDKLTGDDKKAAEQIIYIVNMTRNGK